jgi:hypothetical protein
VKSVAFAVVVAGSTALGACNWSTVEEPAPPNEPSGQSTAAVAVEAGGGSQNHTGGMDARDAGHNPDPGAFGASCTSGADCESNVCFDGGKGGECSLACTADSQCPPGEDGTQHCNPRGYCRY